MVESRQQAPPTKAQPCQRYISQSVRDKARHSPMRGASCYNIIVLYKSEPKNPYLLAVPIVTSICENQLSPRAAPIPALFPLQNRRRVATSTHKINPTRRRHAPNPDTIAIYAIFSAKRALCRRRTTIIRRDIRLSKSTLAATRASASRSP